MILGLKNKQQVRSLGQFMLDELESLITQIKFAWDQDHDNDGRHLQVRERGRETPMGEWIFVPILQTNIRALTGGATFTLVATPAVYYMLIGMTLFTVFDIRVTVGGVLTTGTMVVDLPFNFTVPAKPGGATQFVSPTSISATVSAQLVGLVPGVAYSQLWFTYNGLFPAGGITFNGGTYCIITSLKNRQQT